MPSCFVAGTMVWMADGTNRRIEDVKIGDKVVARNSAHNKVLAFDHPKLGDRKLYSFGDSEPFVTAEHPFMTLEGWKSISPTATAEENPNLKVKRLTEKDSTLKHFAWTPIGDIISHEADPDTQLYNFELSGDHTYYAGGHLVHNKGGDDNNSSSSGMATETGMSAAEVQSMIDDQGMGPERYNPWTEVIDDIRQDTADFGQTVAAGQHSGADQAYDSAASIKQSYDPLTKQNAMNAQGFQYLDPAQQAAMMKAQNTPDATFTEPSRAEMKMWQLKEAMRPGSGGPKPEGSWSEGFKPGERDTAMNNFQNTARTAGVAEINQNAGQILSDMTKRGQDIESSYRTMGDEGYDRMYGRAMDNQQKQITASNAGISQTYAGQNRELMRRGFNPAQIAQLATQNANQQALARVAGTNAAFGQTNTTLNSASDARSNLYNTGKTMGMDVKFSGEDTARSMNAGAEGVMREGFGGAASTGAQFNSDATNASLTTGGNLDAQAATTQQGASIIGQTGALGVMDTLSNDYRTDNPAPGGGGGSGTDAITGAIIGGAMSFSDRRLKENIVEVGEFASGMGVYLYNYIGETIQRIGVMADEVLQVFPEAVLTNSQGYQLVDYAKLKRISA